MKLLQFKILTQIALVFLLFGCASQGLVSRYPASPASLASSSPYPALKNEIDGMIVRELLPYTAASIKVVSLKSGVSLYETNPYLLMQPASVQKLFTAAEALSLLGPDHVIETSVAVNLDNDTLYVKGCGDPLLRTSDLTLLVSDLVGRLPPDRRHYRIVGDTGCFDDEYWGRGWMRDDEPGPTAMHLSALSVNGNTVRVTVSPGKTASAPVEVLTDPSTRYIIIENSGKTGDSGGPCSVSITRRAEDRDNRIRVAGSLALGCPSVSMRLSVWQPELYTLTLLAELLDRAGVEVDPPTIGAAPADAKTLATIQHRVGEIVSLMLKESDNLSAENLLKYLAHEKSGQKGTAEAGAEIIKEYLSLKGINTDQLVIADGSGVSRYNLASADTITRVLAAVYRDQATFPFFVNALPIAGIDGSLAGRMKGTPAEGKVQAKTGTLKGVSALAGYTVTADGEPLAFSMIMENFVGPAQRVHDLQDRIAVLLSTFSTGTSGARD